LPVPDRSDFWSSLLPPAVISVEEVSRLGCEPANAEAVTCGTATDLTRGEDSRGDLIDPDTGVSKLGRQNLGHLERRCFRRLRLRHTGVSEGDTVASNVTPTA
jgi:hypothetical protein